MPFLYWLGYIFLRPVLGFIDMTWRGHGEMVGMVYKAYVCIGIFFLLPSFIRNASKTAGPLRLLMFLFLLYIAYSLVSPMILQRDVAWGAGVSQLFGLVMLIFFIGCYDERVARAFISFLDRYRWVVLSWDALLVYIYMFYANGKSAFDSSHLLPTYIISLQKRYYVSIMVHLALFYVHGKRAMLLVSALLLMLYSLFVWTKGRIAAKLAFLAVILMIVSAAFVMVEKGVDAGSDRNMATVQRVGENGVESDMSFLERLYEIDLAHSQLMTNIIDYVFGRGFGWVYNLEIIIPGERSLSVERSFLHITPAYVFVAFGGLGLVLYLLLLLRMSASMLSADPVVEFWAWFLLAAVVSGLFRLNLFTEPMIAYAIGAIYYKGASSVVLSCDNVRDDRLCAV